MPDDAMWNLPSRRRIYLMRHADVAYFDETGRPVRPDTVPLTEKGQAQARAAASAFCEIPLDRIVSSGLPRTVQTATIVAQGRPIQLETHEGLKEIQPGRLADLPLPSIDQVFTEAFGGHVRRESQFLGGETFGSLCDRVESALNELLADPDWRHLLVVAHGGVNRAILAYALGAGLSSFGAMEQDAACINVIDVDERGRFLVRLFNYTPYSDLKLGFERTTMEVLFLEFARTFLR